VRIGKAIALHLARRGFSIALQYNRSGAEADATTKAIAEAGGKAQYFKADLGSHKEVLALLPAVNQAMGPVACLINNASHFADDRLPALSEAEWERHMAINLKAPVFLAQAFAAQLPPSEIGNIINIVDQRVLRPNPLFFSYGISKAALKAATVTMAQALAPRIRVNAVAPGPTLPNIYQGEGEFEREKSATLLGYGTTPREIAEAVEFILSARAMTGQMIALDGGQHLLWKTPDIIVK